MGCWYICHLDPQMAGYSGLTGNDSLLPRSWLPQVTFCCLSCICGLVGTPVNCLKIASIEFNPSKGRLTTPIQVWSD